MQQGAVTAPGKGQGFHLAARGFLKVDQGLPRLVLVESGFVLASFPVVKGAVVPCTNSGRKCHRAIILFSPLRNWKKQHTFNSAKGMWLFCLCLLAFLLLPSHLACKIESYPSHPLPTGGKVAFKS